MYVIIPSDENRIYEQFLTFMNPFFNLTPNEIKVLSGILRLYKEAAGAAEKIRWGYVFSTEGKEQIKREAGMSTNQLNLTLSGLRKKEIQGDTVLRREPYPHIHPGLCIDPINYSEITIKFKLEDVRESKPETEGNHSEYREEVQPESTAEPELLEPTVSYEQEENHIIHEERGERLPPGYISSYYAD